MISFVSIPVSFSRMMLGIQHENPHNIDITDPTSDQFYNYFRETAKKNTHIYEEVFATIPTDRVRKFDQVGQYTEVPKLKDTDPLQVNSEIRLI